MRKNSIILVWHGNMLIPIYALRKGRYSLLVGLHSDAELLNTFTSFLGYPSIRGSSNKRPIGAILDLVKEIRKNVVAITPDGPRGPRREIKMGTAKIIKKVNPVIIPIGSSSSKKVVLRTWDKFEFPLPFSTISIIIGKPFRIKNEDSPEKICKFIKSKINEVQHHAEKLC
ncbi:MAG: DUF374 domain-containing protein [Candidatus Marinimicrobia bacterium]|nr:DUF374 domain-containing protein [Candidatus Neomarinimicrobiota bacterium]